MTASIRYTVKKEAGETLVAISMASPLDDADVVLGALGRELATGAGPVVFDMSGVGYFNSPAIRHWVNLVEALHRPVRFRACSAYFVEYGSMVHQLFGHGSVESFHAPYRCETCAHEFESFLATATVSATMALPVASCPKCGRATKPAVAASDFLFFLSP